MVEAIVYTACEAAKALKMDPGEFNKKLEAGEIPAAREGRLWKVPKTLLQAYIENRAIAEAKGRREAFEKKGEKDD